MSRRNAKEPLNLIPLTADPQQCVPGSRHHCQHANDIHAQFPEIQAWLHGQFGAKYIGELLPAINVDEYPPTDMEGDGPESRFLPYVVLHTSTGVRITIWSDSDRARSYLNLNDKLKVMLVKQWRKLNREDRTLEAIPWEVFVRKDTQDKDRQRITCIKGVAPDPKSSESRMADRARTAGRRAKTALRLPPHQVPDLIKSRPDYQAATPEIQDIMVDSALRGYQTAGTRTKGNGGKRKQLSFDGPGTRALKEQEAAA